ncbi:hypothetical protein CGCFRS4_v016149, partial [Colletotrichum fructicola]
VAAVRQFCFSLWDHATDADTAHLHQTKDHPCYLIRQPGDPQCPCDRTSMSYNIVHGSNNGGTLAIVPASLVTQTVEKANDLFRPNFSVQFPGKRRRFRGMAITTWEQEKKGNEFSETMQLACAKWNFDYAQPFSDTQRPKPKPAEFKGNPDQLFR